MSRVVGHARGGEYKRVALFVLAALPPLPEGPGRGPGRLGFWADSLPIRGMVFICIFRVARGVAARAHYSLLV